MDYNAYGRQLTDEQMASPTFLIVLGCHRSGTSMLASIFHDLGGKLPKNLLRPSLTNKRGFNESWHWVLANEELLKKMQLTWDSPLPSSQIIESKSFIEKNTDFVIESLKSGFEKNLSSSDKLIIKDPRICRTFPIWERAICEMNFSYNVFLPVRHPFEVINSLGKRDEIEPIHACYIWLWNVIESLISTAHLSPKFVIYEKVLENPTSYLPSILDCEVPPRSINKIEKSLNHNQDSKNLFSKSEEPFMFAYRLYEKILLLNKPNQELIDFVRSFRLHVLHQSTFITRELKRINVGLRKSAIKRKLSSSHKKKKIPIAASKSSEKKDAKHTEKFSFIRKYFK